jgi:hypothetical protein
MGFQAKNQQRFVDFTTKFVKIVIVENGLGKKFRQEVF